MCVCVVLSSQEARSLAGVRKANMSIIHCGAGKSETFRREGALGVPGGMLCASGFQVPWFTKRSARWSVFCWAILQQMHVTCEGR